MSIALDTFHNRNHSAPHSKTAQFTSPPSDLKRPFSAPLNPEEPFARKSRFATMEDVTGADSLTEIINVPDKMVGLIIGRGGEQITGLQMDTGCKIQMAQDSGGMMERQCTLTGSPASIEQAKEAIDRIIANEGNGAGPVRPGGGGMGGGGGGFFEMMVPGHKVGLIIGKGGEMIKQMQEQSGAKIVIIQESAETAHEKPIRITGSESAVEIAKGLVTDVLNQADDRDSMGGFGGRGRGRGGGMMSRGGRGGGGFGFRGAPRGGGRGGGFGGGGWGGNGNEFGGGQMTDYVQVPATKVGLVIGKGGETIKQINQVTGAHCEIDKNAPPDSRDKNFILRGSPEAIEKAKSMIMEKLGFGGAGGYGGNNNGTGSWGSVAQSGYPSSYDGSGSQPGGQTDYSAQWAEYYRSMGMAREAEAIEAQRGVSSVSAAPPANPGASAQQNGADYSAQWAEYYRSMGKLKEAEAIEAQIKQKTAVPGGQVPYSAGYAAGYYGN